MISRQLDPPYESEQVVKKLQDLLSAGVAVDRSSTGHEPNQESSSFRLFHCGRPASSLHNSQDGVHTKADLQQERGTGRFQPKHSLNK